MEVIAAVYAIMPALQFPALRRTPHCSLMHVHVCARTGPEFGGRITKVHNLQEWDALLAEDDKRVVVVDAYALWCPPCKSAAPVYAKMSEMFTEESCVFAKIDVDHAKDVAQRLGIKAMPTFKIFKNKAEVEEQQGWGGEEKLKQMLLSHGAKLADKKAD
jgi:thioredoxin 1